MANLWAYDRENDKWIELDVVELEDGSTALSMVVKDESGGVLGGSTIGNLKIVTDDIVSGDLTTNAYKFDADVDAVWVVNDDDANITVTISTLGFTIKPGESRVIEMEAFDTVTFSASAVFRMNGLRRG